VRRVTEPVIVVDGLHKRYGSFEAVRGTSFTVESGEVFGLLGTNGAGKTTTIEILEGYRARTSGTVSVLGVDPDQPTRAWRERIGLVLQESELDPVFTPRETIAMFARYFRDPRPVDETLHLVGLDDKADARIGALSGGQRRRVDVAVGIIGRPELLFLDEPTTGFDPNARREFWAMIEGLKHTGTTIVLTTHYMDEAQALADRVVIMRRGEIVAQGDFDELSRDHGGGAVIRFSLPASVSASTLDDAATPAVADPTGRLELRPVDLQPTLTRLLDRARDQGITLTDLEVTRPTLDDVFVEISNEGTESEHE
jgi:ABC-2 type transport system ATP-binding protein